MSNIWTHNLSLPEVLEDSTNLIRNSDWRYSNTFLAKEYNNLIFV